MIKNLHIFNLKISMFVLIFIYITDHSTGFANTSLLVRRDKTLRAMVKSISDKKLEQTLRSFVKETAPGRVSDSKGHTKAQNWILNKLKQLKSPFGSVDVWEESFGLNLEKIKKVYLDDLALVSKNDPNYTKWKLFTENALSFIDQYKGYAGKHIFFEVKNDKKTSNDYVYVVTHYDSLSMVKTKSGQSVFSKAADAPGADDNATGVVCALMLAELLTKIDHNMGVRIIFTDMQELAMAGSKAYVDKNFLLLNQNKSKHNVKLVVNFEAIGFDTKTKDLNKRYNNFKLYISKNSTPVYQKEKNAALLLSKLSKSFSKTRYEIDNQGIEIGDNASFWSANIPVLSISQNLEADSNSKNRHSSSDLPEFLNFDSYENTVKSISGFVLALAKYPAILSDN